jgi:hypothetical protein
MPETWQIMLALNLRQDTAEGPDNLVCINWFA